MSKVSQPPEDHSKDDLSTTLKTAREVLSLSTELIHLLYPAYLADTEPAAEWLTRLKSVRAKTARYRLAHGRTVGRLRRSSSINAAGDLWEETIGKATTLGELVSHPYADRLDILS